MKTFISWSLIAAILLNGVAFAQHRPTRPNRRTRQEVALLEREAVQLVQQSDGAESAADLYLRAFALIPRCVYLANAARLLSRVESRRGGVRQYAERLVRRDCQMSLDETELRLATELLAELDAQASTQATPPPQVVPPVPPSPPVVVVPPVVAPPPIVVPRVVPPPIVSPPRRVIRRPIPGSAIGFWVAGGVSLLVGSLSLGWYLDAQQELGDSTNADLGRWQRASDAAFATSLASFGAALVFGGIGTLFYLRRPSVSVQVTPVASPSVAGLRFTLRF